MDRVTSAATRHLLLLGGTGEARELASRLLEHDLPFTSSLAGRVAQPVLPPGPVRIGGFGGCDGLARWLADHRVTAVVDATHPFAQQISGAARAACGMTGVSLLRLERPGWSERPGDRWHRVADLAAAADAVAQLGTRVLLTLGGSGAAAFAHLDQPWFVVRAVDPPPGPLPPRHTVILARGPFTVAAERHLLEHHDIDLVVTRDSGGPMVAAKLEAARALGVPVVLLRRPPSPAVPTVTSVDDALRWAIGRLRAREAAAER